MIDKANSTTSGPSDATDTEIPRPPAARPATPDSEDTRQWFNSMEGVISYALKKQDAERASYFVESLVERLRAAGIKVPPPVNTPYVNTIPVERQPPYPDRKSVV